MSTVSAPFYLPTVTAPGASLEAMAAEKLPSVQETWVRSLVWEHSLQKGMATHSSILA